jgi:hypothetical protein
MCLSHLIYTVRPCLIHNCHAHAMLWPCRSSQGHGTARPFLYGRAVQWPWEERHGQSRALARHGHGTASVNQTRPHCVNQIGKTHSKPLVARHGRGTACYVWIGLRGSVTRATSTSDSTTKHTQTLMESSRMLTEMCTQPMRWPYEGTLAPEISEAGIKKGCRRQ